MQKLFFLGKKDFFLDKECFNRRVFLSKPAGFLIKTGGFSYQNRPVSEFYDAKKIFFNAEEIILGTNKILGKE